MFMKSPILCLLPLVLFSCSSYKVVNLKNIQTPNQEQYKTYIEKNNKKYQNSVLKLIDCRARLKQDLFVKKGEDWRVILNKVHAYLTQEESDCINVFRNEVDQYHLLTGGLIDIIISENESNYEALK